MSGPEQQLSYHHRRKRRLRWSQVSEGPEGLTLSPVLPIHEAEIGLPHNRISSTSPKGEHKAGRIPSHSLRQVATPAPSSSRPLRQLFLHTHLHRLLNKHRPIAHRRRPSSRPPTNYRSTYPYVTPRPRRCSTIRPGRRTSLPAAVTFLPAELRVRRVRRPHLRDLRPREVLLGAAVLEGHPEATFVAHLRQESTRYLAPPQRGAGQTSPQEEDSLWLHPAVTLTIEGFFLLNTLSQKVAIAPPLHTPTPGTAIFITSLNYRFFQHV